MSLISSLVDNLDGFLDFMGSKAKQSFSDYCDLETADDQFTLVSKDGSLLSVVEVQGVRQLTGNNTFYQRMVVPMKTSLQSLFQNKGHAIQVWFEVDHDRTSQEIRRILEPARITAKQLGMDMDDVLEEREINLAKWTQTEACYLVMWTKPSALAKADRKNEAKARQATKSMQNASIANGQDPLRAFGTLRDRHSSFVEAFQGELSNLGVATRLLSAHEAVREVRHSMDASFTGDDWRASLPGDKVFPSQRKTIPAAEEWDIMWPRLGWQVCPRDAHILDDNVVRVGDRIYSPIYVDIFPQEVEFFANLFARAKEKHLPWRMSYLIEGDGLSGFQFKGLVAQLLGFAGASNKAIHRGVEALKSMQNEAGETIVQVRACFCTWAPRDRLDLLRTRASDLARCVEQWGGATVAEVTGDPIAGLASSGLAFTQGSIATKTAAPMEEALSMLPWARPSSPWKAGAVTFRSPDGKIMPYQPYSKEQVTWINLIFAKPGSGKSVLMNMCNLALCLAPDLKRLPRISIIDIGPSSSGLISLLKEALHPDKRKQVMYHRLTMQERDAINPMDTQLGARFPTPSELSFLRNLLVLLVTDVNSDKPYDGMTGLVSAVLDEMYRQRSDKYEPNLYAPGTVPLVDDAVRQAGIRQDHRTTWWEVVDALFEAGDSYHYAAKLAQRQAVPLLADAVGAAQGEKIKNTFGDVRVPGTGESLVSAFGRLIGDALDFFPILARPTAFDVGDARVVALDLDEVAKGSGVVGDRITSVMYMLARQVMAKDYYLTKEVVADIPAPPHVALRDTVPVKAYQDYHMARIAEIREDPKRICYDEFHRTSKATSVREQVLLDMREGRKWKVDVMLASQALEDFDPTMMEFATGLFVMDGGNAMTQEKVANTFGFQDPAERYALERRVHGPRKGGGTFLAKFSTVYGWYTMLLSATLGPIELWAFSTTAEDVIIRNKLYDQVGPKLARKLLAMKYPGGSAKDDIDARKERRRASDEFLIEGEASSMLDEIVEELIDYGQSRGLL